MQIGLANQLSLVEWSFFVTFTSPGGRVIESEAARRRRWFAVLRQVAAEDGQRLSRMPWVLRVETGDHGGRLHYHGLVKVGPSMTNRSGAFWMRWLWSTKFKGGFAEVTLYDRARNGPDYLLKGLGSVPRQTSGAQQYENRKFDLAEEVVLSDGCVRLVRAIVSGRASSSRTEAKATPETWRSQVVPVGAAPVGVTAPLPQTGLGRAGF